MALSHLSRETLADSAQQAVGITDDDERKKRERGREIESNWVVDDLGRRDAFFAWVRERCKNATEK